MKNAFFNQKTGRKFEVSESLISCYVKFYQGHNNVKRVFIDQKEGEQAEYCLNVSKLYTKHIIFLLFSLVCNFLDFMRLWGFAYITNLKRCLSLPLGVSNISKAPTDN